MRQKLGGRGGGGGSEHQAVVLICKFSSDDAKTVTSPPVPSPSPHPSVSLPMPRSCQTGDSDTQQVKLVTLLCCSPPPSSLTFVHCSHTFITVDTAVMTCLAFLNCSIEFVWL